MSSNPFINQVGVKEARKLKALQRRSPSVWLGLGVFGLIGWSVVVPTLLGAALGLWLDKRYPGPHSRTLALLMAGLSVGCWNAWRWITKSENHHPPEADHD